MPLRRRKPVPSRSTAACGISLQVREPGKERRAKQESRGLILRRRQVKDRLAAREPGG